MKVSVKIHYSFSLAFVFCLLLFAGCNKERVRIMTFDDSNYDLPIEVSKQYAALEIKNYRILVFSAGSLVSDTEFSNTQSDAPMAKVKVVHGINNFYVFCNQTPELKAKIDQINMETDLENIYFSSPKAGPNVEIPMYGKIMGAKVDASKTLPTVTVDGLTKTHLSVAVDRLMVKLSLTFIKNIDLPADDFVVEELKISLHRMPKTTYIKKAYTYSGAEWQDVLTQTATGTLNNNGAYTVDAGSYSLDPGIDFIKFTNIYLPEHILQDSVDKEQASYIAVEATYRMKNGDPSPQQMVYLIYLGQNPPNTYHLPRNNHIDIYATIRKLGEGIITSFDIAPWEDGGSIDVEEPEGIYYLNLSAATVVYPETFYVDKDKDIFIKDENGQYVSAVPDYNYTCFFWTNRPSNTLSTTNFMMDQDPDKTVNITQSMSITEDNILGGEPNVKGKIDIHIPSQDIIDGLLKTYSMRLKADKVDRKLVFTVPNYDLIPGITYSGKDTIDDLIITNHGLSTAKSTSDTIEMEFFIPQNYTLSAEFVTAVKDVKFTFVNVTPAGTDVFSMRKYKIIYTCSSPRRVTLGWREVRILILNTTNEIVYTSPFSLKFNIKE